MKAFYIIEQRIYSGIIIPIAFINRNGQAHAAGIPIIPYSHRRVKAL